LPLGAILTEPSTLAAHFHTKEKAVASRSPNGVSRGNSQNRLAVIRDCSKFELLQHVARTDLGSYFHCRRVALIAGAIAQALRLPAWQITVIMDAALLHDVAKALWPRRLFESSALTDDDWQIVHRHPDEGAAILAGIDELAHLAPLVIGHHRYFDGSTRGYGGPPRRGVRLPLPTRVVSVADVVDVLTSRRSYSGPARSVDDCFAELLAVSGTQLDPRLVAGAIAARALVEPVVLAGQNPGRISAA
jgi:HD-GYP domain-containing protein (c-di-GMP phosphodiesterase class II)